MIPILTAAQVREADAWTIAHGNTTSTDLMEQAARACTNWILQDHRDLLIGGPVYVLCGMGNNGGDGLAIARQLHEQGSTVVAAIVHHRAEATKDHALNLDRYTAAGGTRIEVRRAEDLASLTGAHVIIDALVGTGLSRPLDGLLAEVVERINALPATVISIDLPSGLDGDALPLPKASIVRADHTLCFQVPRPVFFHAEAADHVGDGHVLPIGLDTDHIQRMHADRHLLEAKDMAALLPVRPRFAHKGTFGHALLIAGGIGHAGAAVLAARSCSRSGAGLCTIHAPSGLQTILQTAVPEAMCRADAEVERIVELPSLGPFDAVGVGPGVGTHPGTARMLKRLIQEAVTPLVIDADALNILSENTTWLGFLPRGTVLTPHPKEFDRLAGRSSDSMERLQRARDMAVKYGCVIVLKGACTAVCDASGRVYFNPTGNPGMARGGSGDVLTGLLTGSLAQGIPVLSAALLATYLHGAAGDRAAAALGMDGMTASDLIAHLPAAFQELRSLA